MKRQAVLAGVVLGIACFCALLACFAGTGEKTYAQLRKRMVEQQLAARDITDRRILEAMGTIPRHLFVSPAYRELAYADHPLPIGDDQTISQPYIVALMTQLLEVQSGDKVLEVGTGSGYQAAVLAHLSEHIFSVEIIQELAERASQTLKELGYDQARVKWSDGHTGWKEEAPFEAIIITCATSEIPPDLFAQLNEGGRMVLPLGNPATYQVLTVVTKIDGQPHAKQISGVRFVPMTKKIKSPA